MPELFQWIAYSSGQKTAPHPDYRAAVAEIQSVLANLPDLTGDDEVYLVLQKLVPAADVAASAISEAFDQLEFRAGESTTAMRYLYDIADVIGPLLTPKYAIIHTEMVGTRDSLSAMNRDS